MLTVNHIYLSLILPLKFVCFAGFFCSLRNTVNLTLLTLYANFYLLCRYLAAKSEADHYAIELMREKEEINSVPDTGTSYNDFFSQR